MNKTYKKGGKYLGQGAYGCGFAKPPLKCKNESRRRSNLFITKLMRNNNAKEEMEEASLWQIIDPEQKFSIYTEKKCELNTNNIKSENDFEKCTIEFKNNSQKTLLISKFGGDDLFELKPTSTNYSKLFKAFIPLIKGLNKAHGYYVTHNDIKEENIVAEVKHNSIVLRFIDFGFSYLTKHMIEMSPHFLNTTGYYYWPFEFGCFDTHGELYPFEKVKKRYELIGKKYEEMNSSMFPVTYLARQRIDIKDLYDHYKKIKFNDFETTFRRLDTYSIGITLAKVLYYYFRVYILELGGKLYIVSDAIDNEINEYSELVASMKDAHQKDWVTIVYNSIILPMINLIVTMTSIVPDERPSLDHVIDELEKLVPHINKYFTPNQIKKGLRGFNILNKDIETTLNIAPPPPPPPSISSKDSSPVYNINKK